MERYGEERAETQKKRILVLCGNEAAAIAAANTYVELFKDHEVRFIEEQVVSIGRILIFSRRRMKRLGLLSLLGVYLLYIKKFIHPEQKAAKKYTPSLHTKNISEDQAVESFIKEFTPDAIIIGFCGLLKKSFLQKIGQNIYNTHPGINPRYRGFGNIWAFYENNFSNAGYTVHYVDEGIDTGKRIALASLSFAGVKFEDTEAYAAAMAARHLVALILGQEQPHIPKEFSQMPSHCYGVPSLATYYTARRNYNRYQAATKQRADSMHNEESTTLEAGATPAQPRGTYTQTTPQRHILITGASGGLGEALALEYAQPGSSLSLWGRNEERLQAIAAACNARGASAAYVVQDMRELEKTRERLLALDADQPFDLVVINAGISSGVSPKGELESPEDVCRLFEVNATGAVNVASTLVHRMRERNSGQLVLMSSLAAYFPLPGSPAYSASKAALLSYARAMNMLMDKTNVRVSVVCPGYVDTAMSRRLKGAQPFRWSAPKAAAYIRRRLESGFDQISFPWLLTLGIRCLNFLPNSLATFFLARFAFTIEPDAESLQSSHGAKSLQNSPQKSGKQSPTGSNAQSG